MSSKSVEINDIPKKDAVSQTPVAQFDVATFELEFSALLHQINGIFQDHLLNSSKDIHPYLADQARCESDHMKMRSFAHMMHENRASFKDDDYKWFCEFITLVEGWFDYLRDQ